MSPQSKPKSQSRGAKKEMTFFDLLKQDHNKVRDMFEQIEEDEEAENRNELFSGLRSELQEHMDLEEKFFYPVMEGNDDIRDKALESYEQHNVAKIVMGDLGNLDTEDERWNAKMKVLHGIVNLHLQDEEKNIFKTAKNALDQDQIKQITDQIMQQKGQAEEKAA